MTMHYVYIVLCTNSALYTGYTTDVAKRFDQHKNKTGAKYTKAFPAVELVYSEQRASRSDALKREAQIKRLSRAEKMSLVSRSRATENAVVSRTRHGSIQVRYTSAMAQGSNAGVRQKKSRPHKTAKRLAAKKAMLAARASKKRR